MLMIGSSLDRVSFCWKPRKGIVCIGFKYSGYLIRKIWQEMG